MSRRWLPVNKKLLPNLTIFQKGIALGIGLLVLEFAALLALLLQVQTANSLNDDLQEMTEVYVHTQGLMSTLYNSRGSFLAWLQGSDANGLEHFRRIQGDSDADFQFLKEKRKIFEGSTMLNRVLSQKISIIESLVHDWAIKVDRNINQLNALPPMERAALTSENREVTMVRSEVQLKLVALAQALQDKLGALSDKELTNYRYMQGISIFAVLGNIVICILMGVFLGMDLVSRLRVMVENTARLADERELLAPLKGKDELAQSDELFHQLEKEISELRQLKRSYIHLFRDELSAPLNKVLEVFQRLQGTMTGTDKDSMVMAERNLARLVDIIDDLTESQSKGGIFIRLKKKNVSAQDLINRSVESVAKFAQEHGVTIDAGNCDHKLFADGDRLQQVLVNLLSNAAKFSPKNSVVSVRCELSNDQFLFSVSDKGRGIPEDVRKKLFEKFTQTDESDGKRGVGTGLGLSICKTIVELHGGRIGVESEPGVGSKFWFEIPQKLEEPAK